MKRGALVVVTILAVAGVLAAVGATLRDRIGRKRSVLLVTVDTLRADHVGAYGRAPSITPAIDALAARGAVFEHVWTTAPLTVPAHASLLTGLLPPQHGLRSNHPAAPLPPQDKRPYNTLAEVFRAQGWRTAAFVSASVLRKERTGLDAGFEIYDDVPPAKLGALHDEERRGEETVAAALAWARSGERPFFLWVHLFDPHAPYDAPPPWGAGSEHAGGRKGYDGEVRYADHCVGLLLDGLAAAGHDDLVVAVVADHGEGLGDHEEATHGYLLRETTVRVPLVIAAPSVPEGTRRTDLVSIAHVPTTLLGLGGASLPEVPVGRPLFPEPKGAPAPLYAETLYPWESCRWAQTFAMRTGDLKAVDSGSRVLGFDLSAEPGEVAVDAPGAELTALAARAHEVAGRPPVGVFARRESVQGGSYFSAAPLSASPVLARDENARLPSPYDRMHVAAALDRGRSQLVAGQKRAALVTFLEAANEDPTNPEAEMWHARALEVLGRNAEAAASNRRAFELGWRNPEAVAKALQMSVKAVLQDGESSEVESGLAFLDTARTAGVPPTAKAHVFEGLLRIQSGEWDLAAEAFDRAERAEPDELTRRGIAEGRKHLADTRTDGR